MKHLMRSMAVLATLAACTTNAQPSGSEPQADGSPGRGALASEAPIATPMQTEDAKTRAILLRLKGPEEERPKNFR